MSKRISHKNTILHVHVVTVVTEDSRLHHSFLLFITSERQYVVDIQGGEMANARERKGQEWLFVLVETVSSTYMYAYYILYSANDKCIIRDNARRRTDKEHSSTHSNWPLLATQR